IATGLAGGATGTQIIEQLTRESIVNDFVRISEDSRTNTNLIDPRAAERLRSEVELTAVELPSRVG
ncbi:MAG TPA: hypothetical protein VHM72_05510, partial [Solirubrobacteraceae bacterium]|nr:hypothetical protein [Solirubrobacteraceae bacterium]